MGGCNVAVAGQLTSARSHLLSSDKHRDERPERVSQGVTVSGHTRV